MGRIGVSGWKATWMTHIRHRTVNSLEAARPLN
jgi:hypothetical protein